MNDLSGMAEFFGSRGPAMLYKIAAGSLNPFSRDLYYWRYCTGGLISGPFKSLEETERHILGCLAASGRSDESIQENVIFVDFTNKAFLRDGKWTKTKKAMLKSKMTTKGPGLV